MRHKPEELIYRYQNIFLETDLYEESLVLGDMFKELQEQKQELQQELQRINLQLQNQKQKLQEIDTIIQQTGTCSTRI